MSKVFKIQLPLPRTQNHAQQITTRGKRPRLFNTAETNEWKEDCYRELHDSKFEPFDKKSNLLLTVVLLKSGRGKWDSDNRIKQLQDVMRVFVYHDDDQIVTTLNYKVRLQLSEKCLERVMVRVEDIASPECAWAWTKLEEFV